MQFKRTFIILMLLFSGWTIADSQSECKTFTKKKCMYKLSPFVNNGQTSSTFMNPGQSSDISMNFNAGQTYRIIVCSQEELADLEYKISDGSGKVLFNSKDHDNADFWDFNVKSTTQLKISVKVPASDDKKASGGCVTVLVGFKQ
jgi:hypothetical protein